MSDDHERTYPDDAVTKIHCSFCGAQLLFSRQQIDYLLIIPPCPRCDERTWLHSVDGQAVTWPAAT